jgi:glycine/D-amino acid oxidase-like deaminating enzyme
MTSVKHAGAVVIGGGITGCNVAYHLAKARVRLTPLDDNHGDLVGGAIDAVS